MPKQFDDETFTSLEEHETDNEPNQENSNMECDNDKVDLYITTKSHWL